MSSNFLVFDENLDDLMSDPDYLADSQRLNGLAAGLAATALHNKFYLQTSTMAAAIAQVLSNLGYTISDQNYAGLVTAIQASFVTHPISSVVAKSSAGSALAAADIGTFYNCTGTFTISCGAAASLGSGWYVYIRNSGTGCVTVAPNGAETIDGLTSVKLGPGNACLLTSNGVAALFTQGRRLEFAIVQDQKAAGTDGGTFTSGAFQTRTLNTVVTDPCSLIGLASNQITLQPGYYHIRAEAPAFYCNSHKALLYNVTDAANSILGTSETAGVTSGNGTTSRSIIDGYINLTTAKVFEVRHSCDTTRTTNGFGLASNMGVTEIYTTVFIEKLT